jgi:hypothetical protein
MSDNRYLLLLCLITGTVAALKNGWKIGSKLAGLMGTKVVEEGVEVTSFVQWGLKTLDEPFFAVTIASTIGAFVFSEIAKISGANTVVVDVADVVGGTVGGAAAGFVLGG